MTRRVVLIFGPPGAGKTTLAHQLGLEVYDRDDTRWHNDEGQFRAALQALATNPHAQAAVIRTGRTHTARAAAARLCRPTETIVLDVPAHVCRARVKARGRGNVKAQLAAIDSWWSAQTQPTQARRRAL